MACLAPGALVTTARGLVPIESVQVDDLVLTHRARWRRVTGTSSRAWRGYAVETKPRGLRGLVTTPEHPFWSAHAWFERAYRSNRLVPRDWDFRDAATLRAGRKAKGDFLLAPAAVWPGLSVDVDREMAFLVGLYLAEGYVADHQACFSFNADEDFLVEFVRKQAAQRYGASITIDRRTGTKSLTVSVNSTKMRDDFSVFGKRERKGLPWIGWMSLPSELALMVVRGWLVGDGSTSRGKQSCDHLRGVSVSHTLIYQMQQFLWRAGLLPSVCPFAQTGMFQGKPCFQLPAEQLSLSASDSFRLLFLPLDVERERWKGRTWGLRERTNSCAVPQPEGAAVKVASVRRVPFDGVVFNLHVEEDESFVAEGVAVHNSWFAREGARRYQRSAQGSVGVRVIG